MKTTIEFTFDDICTDLYSAYIIVDLNCEIYVDVSGDNITPNAPPHVVVNDFTIAEIDVFDEFGNPMKNSDSFIDLFRPHIQDQIDSRDTEITEFVLADIETYKDI